MNAMIKTSVLGLTFVVLVAALIGAAQARDDGRYSQSAFWREPGSPPCASTKDWLLATAFALAS